MPIPRSDDLFIYSHFSLRLRIIYWLFRFGSKYLLYVPRWYFLMQIYTSNGGFKSYLHVYPNAFSFRVSIVRILPCGRILYFERVSYRHLERDPIRGIYSEMYSANEVDGWENGKMDDTIDEYHD